MMLFYLQRLLTSCVYRHDCHFACLCLKTDDGSTDEPNAILDDLVHVDLLEQHHQDNMYFVTSILDRVYRFLLLHFEILTIFMSQFSYE